MERGNNLNLPSFTARRLIGWLSVALFFLVDLFARLSVDVIEENLMEDFQIDATIASSVFGSSVFFLKCLIVLRFFVFLKFVGTVRLCSGIVCFCSGFGGFSH